MSDTRGNNLPDQEGMEMAELNDDALDAVAGGYIYHDAGDEAAHRKEQFYVIDDKGTVVMRLDSFSAAKHWAGNLRTSQRIIDAKEFDQLRKGGKL